MIGIEGSGEKKGILGLPRPLGVTPFKGMLKRDISELPTSIVWRYKDGTTRRESIYMGEPKSEKEVRAYYEVPVGAIKYLGKRHTFRGDLDEYEVEVLG